MTKPPQPGPFTDTLLTEVARALDTLIAASTPYGGLFPGLLELSGSSLIRDLPPAIPGQRNGDRTPLGSDLIHDQTLLFTLYALADALGRPDYEAAADRYLRRFATHCTDTASGLFPWGEHAYWHLPEDRAGNSYADARGQASPATHDHLRFVPAWVWEKLYAFNPRCVERFAAGLENHWVNTEKTLYNRHALIAEVHPYPWDAPRACDFPRHSGFYVFDLAFAFAKTGQRAFLGQLRRFLDYWWEKRDEAGLLLIESHSPPHELEFYNVKAPGQTLSLGVSLLEAAALLPAVPELAGVMRARARVYFDAFLGASHDVQAGRFVLFTGNEPTTMPLWGSRYGVPPATSAALTALCAYRLTNDERLLAWARAVGEQALTTPFPADAKVPAMDAGLGLGLLADLYDLTGETRWLDAGLSLAETVLALYLDHALPRGASGTLWYESQTGPSFLLHGLARVALLARDGVSCPLLADYTAR